MGFLSYMQGRWGIRFHEYVAAVGTGGKQMSTGQLHLDGFEALDSAKTKTRYPNGYLVFMAEDEGFEPPQTESESGVLPLHKSSIAGTFVIIRTFLKMSRSFLKFFQISDGITMPCKSPVYSSQGKGFPAKT